MVIKSSKHLVIDTCVVIAISEKSEHPTSENCLQFLNTVKKICHKVVMTESILHEWLTKANEHKNRYTPKWLGDMQDREKVVGRDMKSESSIQSKIIQEFTVDQGRDQMLNDLHLIEAALAADRIIVSLDENARKHFQNASNIISELREIVWVNPTHINEDPIQWLREGAKLQVERMLGFEKL